MGSSRLPGKVMMKIKNKPLLFYLLNQIKDSKVKIIVATSTSPQDDVIEEYVKSFNLEVFRGNEIDVLDRFYQCAKKFSAKTIIRISADSPLINLQVIDECINHFKKNNFDYLSNTIKFHNGDWIEDFNGFPKGFAVEIFSFNALEEAWQESKKQSDREHVTEYIWKHSDKFKLGNFNNNQNFSNLRLVVDYPQDFELIRNIIDSFPTEKIIDLNEIISFLEKNPHMAKINSNLS